jgi:hypothetical protein
LEEESVAIRWFRSGFYGGLKIGNAKLDSDSGDLDNRLEDLGHATDSDLTNDDSTFAVYGGYRFERPFSVELGWVNLGQVESEIASTPADVDEFLDDVADEQPFLGEGVNLRGIYHFLDRERFQVGVSLGIWVWDAELEAEAADGNRIRISESGVDLNFGLQAQASLGNGFSVLVSVERYILDDNDANTIWIGVQGSF